MVVTTKQMGKILVVTLKSIHGGLNQTHLGDLAGYSKEYGGQSQTDVGDCGCYSKKYGGYNQIDVRDFGGQ